MNKAAFGRERFGGTSGHSRAPCIEYEYEYRVAEYEYDSRFEA
jgi:hypothetical protein